MEDIYLKIKIAEEHLQSLRIKLEATEKAYEMNANARSALASVTLPFLLSACASAKAASLAAGSRPQ